MTVKGTIGTRLALEHQSLLESYWKPLREKYLLPFAEYSFANAYLFRRVHAYELLEGPYPFVAGKNRQGQPYMIPTDNLKNTTAILDNSSAVLFPIPDEWKESMPHGKYTMNPDDSDYLFEAQKMRTLAGRKLSSRRNLIHQLEREHEIYSKKLTEKTLDDARYILEKWQEAHALSKEQTDYDSVLEALVHLERLGLCGCVTYADDQPAGFTIGEILNSQVALVHFAKGLRPFKGIVPYLYRHIAEHIPPEIRWINLEQDLGSPSLRQAKKAYVPDLIVNKWYYRR